MRKYEPKVIFNPSNRMVEFMVDHVVYEFQPGEKKLLDGFVADYVNKNLNSPLREYIPETDDELVTASDIAYDKMPWKDVVALASKKGLFKPGMSKELVLKALAEADEGA